MAHDVHHHTEGKKAVFGPGVIMGLSFWLFAFFFLSLCDGNKEHGNAHGGHGHEAVKTEQTEKAAETPAATKEEH